MLPEILRRLDDYRVVRTTTERLCSPLAIEDYVVQAMPDVSPIRWHLAHTSWFFETFLLAPHLSGYRAIDERYGFLFNSYYNSAGPQFSRPDRGHLSRPTVAEIYGYRAHVDKAMVGLLEALTPARTDELLPVIDLGLNHEQQHQELILTDIKYNLSRNPLRPPYQAQPIASGPGTSPLGFVDLDGGVHELGYDGQTFAFDNESPRHRVFLAPYRLANRTVTNAEYLEFVDAGGYDDWKLWLSDGWKTVQEARWRAPLYWERIDGEWWTYTLSGLQPVDPHAPVTHVSHYEADAFARWAGKRLPTEAEWEHAAESVSLEGNLLETEIFHPVAAPEEGAASGFRQMIGDAWEWTSSAYVPYPGFRPFANGLGEYNGKFMVNQMVLRGGSCVTPRSHIRRTYRNFFPPSARWQFSGIRLAADA